jgi:hypothetical protein
MLGGQVDAGTMATHAQWKITGANHHSACSSARHKKCGTCKHDSIDPLPIPIAVAGRATRHQPFSEEIHNTYPMKLPLLLSVVCTLGRRPKIKHAHKSPTNLHTQLQIVYPRLCTCLCWEQLHEQRKFETKCSKQWQQPQIPCCFPRRCCWQSYTSVNGNQSSTNDHVMNITEKNCRNDTITQTILQ